MAAGQGRKARGSFLLARAGLILSYVFDYLPSNVPVEIIQFLTLYVLILKLKATEFSEISVSAYVTSRCHIPEEQTRNL
jgi:hypothetical protein